MEILSVTLKNFKSHSDRHFTFQPGTNAICGENGAGKTSILEAIAWTLFNHRGLYRIEDLIRNGAGSAQVAVTFVSSRDERTYQVQRCTSKGYSLYDPQLSERLPYKHIDDEVMPWLRQHLGVDPGTNLGKLFANTIGVPQGTFTVDFLKTADERKLIFDAILKVEEYRQVQKDSRQLEKYAEVQVEKLQEAIASYEEDLKNWDNLQQRQRELSQEITQAEATLAALQTELLKLQAEKDQLTAQAQQVQQLEQQLQTLTTQIEGKRQANTLLEKSLHRAQQAVQTCELNSTSYQAFLQTEAALKALDQQSKQRQALLKQREGQQKKLAERQTELTKLTLQLENLARAQVEIQQLQPLIQQQVTLEQQQAEVTEQLQQLQAFGLERQNFAKQLAKVQLDLERLEREIWQIRSFELDVRRIPALEQQRDRLQSQLSRIEAAKQFEAELRQLVMTGEQKRDRHQIQAEQALAILQQVQQSVPLLATLSVESALTAIQAGVDINTELLGTLQQILHDLAEQTSAPKLQQQLQQIRVQLDRAYQQRLEFSTLEAKIAQQVHLKDEIQQIQTRISQLQAQLVAESDWQQRRSHLAAKLTQLSDPRNRSQLLERELQQQSQLQATHAQIQQVQATIQQAIAGLETQLTGFADLEEQIEQQKQLRQMHQSGYLAYLQAQKDATSLPNLQVEFQAVAEQLQQLEAKQLTLQTEYERLSQVYDPQQRQQIEAVYSETRSQSDQLIGGLPQQRKLLNELDVQLEALRAVAEKRDRTQLELRQREQVRRFITFARRVYKEAGPRITERYVQSISKEADKLFRELMNRQNVALEWTRDYEINIQEGSHSRRFINLSGGEQMCAALAVRLALLRILADIDIAFFDEPTTNMDRSRRESLAEAIANIKTFRQLFVISHDDTFEKVTENVILVERES